MKKRSEGIYIHEKRIRLFGINLQHKMIDVYIAISNTN